MSGMTARRGRTTGPVRRWLGGRALAFLALAAAAGVPAAAAFAQGANRTISNIATLDWDNGAQRGQLASNRVDLAVRELPPRTPILIRTESSVSQDIVSEGELVQFRILVRNLDGAQRSGLLTITSRIPAGMRLVADSIRVQGVTVSTWSA